MLITAFLQPIYNLHVADEILTKYDSMAPLSISDRHMVKEFIRAVEKHPSINADYEPGTETVCIWGEWKGKSKSYKNGTRVRVNDVLAGAVNIKGVREQLIKGLEKTYGLDVKSTWGDRMIATEKFMTEDEYEQSIRDIDRGIENQSHEQK